MTIPKVDELTSPPAERKLYRVWTIKYEWFGMFGVWPIIGPKHSDAEIINYPHLHYHIDGRFLTEMQWRHAERSNLRGVHYALAAQPMVGKYAGQSFEEKLPEPALRRRLCRASHLPYVAEVVTTLREDTFIPKLRAAFCSKQLIRGPDGWICPHRGAHMGSIAADTYGVITCPLHGLRWNAETGDAA